MRINRKQLPMQLRDLLSISILLIAQCICVATTDAGIDDIDSGPYQIEGRILAPELETNSVPNWQRNTVISINDGEYTGYLTEKGEFVISGIPAGSYVVDIVNADYYYESVSFYLQIDSSHLYTILIISGSYTHLSTLSSLSVFCIFLGFFQVRVEINNRGKFRARKLNYVQPSQVVQLPYPLRMKAATRFKYFQTREQWKVSDNFT